ncbi:hypothetical protein D3C86_2170720 [compost metagenome]
MPFDLRVSRQHLLRQTLYGFRDDKEPTFHGPDMHDLAGKIFVAHVRKGGQHPVQLVVDVKKPHMRRL